MPKVLVAGDVGGNLDELFKRVGAVNSKSGPFDCLLCTGEFFGSADVGGEGTLSRSWREDRLRCGRRRRALVCPEVCGRE